MATAKNLGPDATGGIPGRGGSVSVVNSDGSGGQTTQQGRPSQNDGSSGGPILGGVANPWEGAQIVANGVNTGVAQAVNTAGKAVSGVLGAIPGLGGGGPTPTYDPYKVSKAATTNFQNLYNQDPTQVQQIGKTPTITATPIAGAPKVNATTINSTPRILGQQLAAPTVSLDQIQQVVAPTIAQRQLQQVQAQGISGAIGAGVMPGTISRDVLPGVANRISDVASERVRGSELDPYQTALARNMGLDTRAQQQGAIGLLQTAANGNAPSAAAILQRAGLNDAVAGQLALANSARGGSAQRLAAQRQAQTNIGQLQMGAISQFGALRAQEMAQARDALTGALSGVRGQDVSQQGLELQGATTQAQLSQQANLANQASYLQAAQGNQATQLAGLSTEQQNALSIALANQQTGLQAGLANQQARLTAATSDQANSLQAQLANQGVSTQALLANQQFGLQGQLANQQAYQQALLANQQSGLQTGLANQATNLAAQQATAGYGMQASLANQSANLAAQQASAQFSAQIAMANQQAGLAASQGTANLQMQGLLANQQSGLTAQQLDAQRQIAAAQGVLGAQQLQYQAYSTPQALNAQIEAAARAAKAQVTGSLFNAGGAILAQAL